MIRTVLCFCAMSMPSVAAAATLAEISEFTGLRSNQIEVLPNTTVRISGARTLTAQSINFDAGPVEIRNVLITQAGRGDVFAASMMSADPTVLKDLVSAPFSTTCIGTPKDVFVRGLAFSADPDASITNRDVETAYADSVKMTLISGDDCFGVSRGDVKSGSAVSAHEDEMSFAHLIFDLTSQKKSAEISDLAFTSSEGVRVLTMDLFSMQGDSLEMTEGHVQVQNLSFIPKDFLYPDLLRRAEIAQPEQPLRIDLDADLRSDSDVKVTIDVKAERLIDFSGELVLQGDDPFGSPLSASFVSGDITFEDLGLFKLIKGFSGKSIAEVIREGDIPGAPSQLASSRFLDMRSSIADWVDTGRGDVSAHPETPVAFAALGAAFMMFPKSIPDILAVKDNMKVDTEKP